MRKLVLPLLLFWALPGCNSQDDQVDTVKGYRLDMPEKFNLPESLLEVSGICFYRGKPDTIYAVQDEQGRVFRLAWNEKKQYNAKFGKQGDYEDLSIVSNRVFILKSNGTLFSFPFADAIYEEVDDVKEWKEVLPKGEYEGMWGDEANGMLYVICKNCEDDNNKKQVSGFIIQAGDSLSLAGRFVIDVEQIRDIAGKVKRGFRPSAIAKNPVSGEWFIVSSVNKLLVVADKDWRIQQVCYLHGNSFNQPEGIAFDEKGNLYISNEGDDLSQGNILKFVRAG